MDSSDRRASGAAASGAATPARPHEGRSKRVRRLGSRGFELRDLPLDGEGALYEQIYRALREAILSGRVQVGTRLPTTRALAKELGLSRNTVVSAFEPLRAEGYIVSRVGAGTFVAALGGGAASTGSAVLGGGVRSVGSGRANVSVGDPATPIPARSEDDAGHATSDAHSALRLSRYGQGLLRGSPRERYDAALGGSSLEFDFRPCVPDLETLPYEPWRRALARTAHHAGTEVFDYADPAGNEPLRQAIAGYLGRARGIECAAPEIVIVGGVAQALDLATRLFLDPGDPVLLENPHYLGARRAFESAGAESCVAPVDPEGVDLSRVEPGTLDRCRMAYVTPSHQFPTGVVMSLSRRLELLRWADRANAFVFEDDYDSEFRYAGRAIPSLKSLDESGRVIYVGTFSKTLLPALRTAYLVLPRSLVDLFRSAKWLSDWSAPSFEQAALTHFLESGDFERHLRRARTLYAGRRSALVGAIDKHLAAFEPAYHDSHAGLHLLLRLEAIETPDLEGLVARGRGAGLGLYPASPCHLGARAPDTPLELVMGFARLEPRALEQGIARLATLLAELPLSPSEVQPNSFTSPADLSVESDTSRGPVTDAS